mmetsp:Transcript_105472/g.264098  ORF Transcript_105472/g.264098 Transcript_105472/m.264098 type:complete len:464 (+) Transcript_105472:134-1525(+)
MDASRGSLGYNALQQQIQGLEGDVGRLWHRNSPAQPSSAPRVLLAPPPPPAPPPPTLRANPSSSPQKGGAAPSTATPGFSPNKVQTQDRSTVGRRLSKVLSDSLPQRDETMVKLLCGLGEESFSVQDVIGIMDKELRSVPAPTAVPSRPVSPSSAAAAGVSRPPGGRGNGSTGDPARLTTLERQLRAVCQSLAGLGARMFNWSISANLKEVERNGLWDLILQYLEPCREVDERISDTCKGLGAALGEARPPPEGRAFPRLGGNSGGTAASAGTSAREASPQSFNAEQSFTDTYHATPEAIARGAPLASFASAQARSPRPPQEGSGVDEVLVAFSASRKARRLNGAYQRVQNLQVNKRPVYERGGKHIVFLNDGTWCVKDGPDGNEGAFVYAFAEDTAQEPFAVRSPWQVLDDGDGFVAEAHGSMSAKCRATTASGSGTGSSPPLSPHTPTKFPAAASGGTRAG